MNDGSAGNPATPEVNPENVSMLDKILDKNPFSHMGSGGVYANVETKSAIKSSREEAREQLAAIEAYNAEVRRRQKMAEDAAKAKRTIVHVIVGAFFACLVIAAVWLAINVLIASRPTIAPREEKPVEEPEKTELVKVEGYNCANAVCGKIADLDNPNIIIQDGSSYFIYNTEDKATTLTVIPEKEYHSITPFNWANKKYAVLDPEVGQSALYDITGNRVITDFAYDNFYTDSSDNIYKDMGNFLNSYIIAKSSGLVQLVDVNNGKEMVRAGKKVFVRDAFFFGYENDGTIHVYLSSKGQFLVINADSNAYVRDSELIVVYPNERYDIYLSDGSTDWDRSSIAERLEDIDWDLGLLNVLNGDSNYYKISTK